ncbi:41130_t:CDS:2, partial [Gigaspora margarita]
MNTPVTMTAAMTITKATIMMIAAEPLVSEVVRIECDIKNCTKKEYSCGKDGMTQPLWRHLESAYWAQYTFIKEYHTSTIVSTEVDNIKLRKMVATWIINQQRSLSIIEDTELIEILQYLNPTVQLVKADTIKKTIMMLYSLGKQELWTYLFNISSKLSFISDLWTSPNNKSYISATAHYIDENWVLKKIIIDFGLLSGKHDGVNIANRFYQILEDYNIVSKFLAITLDNATNNNVFVRELAIKLKKKMDVSWDPECLRFQCFNHILNLAAQAALKLNSVIRTTPQRIELFESICNACRIKFIKPILDCPTRWNSTHDMIKNGLFLKSCTALEKIGEFLEPFKDLTIKMSSSSNSTAFWIIPLFNILFNHVEDVVSNVNANNESASFNDNMSFSISGNTIKSRTQSILDDDFEEDKENTDELDCYILEKPASKEIDVLAWWK